MLTKKDILRLKNTGWVKKNIGEKNKDELLEIGCLLGAPIPSRNGGDVVDELIPVSEMEAVSCSLSSIHGKNEFPLHTDTAYMKIPVRFIILYVKNPGSGDRPTFLVDGYKLVDKLQDDLKLSIYKIKNGRHSFLGNIVEKVDETILVRFDEGCMSPATRDSCKIKKKFSSFLKDEPKMKINWRQGDILIIDNWRVLHGRGNSIKNDNNRLLYRLSISRGIKDGNKL
ncbi:TauD/TfdA family dioxygenase [Guptibacillus hwajinpoensis]|uniref:TauD/TfdA family dioxygenase n=1 Tax=Guptibacillus hwajinpoensis TaxID=208199 RepID=UPI0024B36FD7|nr:TauD/TfdA family dioxygenase [Pseudalkalibacillus hwajinpoensis]